MKIIKQKQPHMPISVLTKNTYMHGSCMITIGRIPKKLQGFFRPVKKQVSGHVYDYFWSFVLAMCIGHGSAIDKLVKLLRNSAHRTNHGEFLWRSNWGESAVMQHIALDLLCSLFHKKDRNLFFIIDDTQILKRAKKMDAVGKLFHHATGKYGHGHTLVKVCLYYRGVTIPWASLLYVKKEHAVGLGIEFFKLTQLAGQAIRRAELPGRFKVTVLFDAFYLCPEVANACKERKWHYISVGALNRCFKVKSQGYKLGKYGRKVLNNSGAWRRVAGLRKTKTYRLAERIGRLNKLGEVKIVFSRRKGDRKHIALVTDDVRASMEKIVADYLKRWAIEMLIKDEKQHLGLGDYRVLRYRAVVRHLHLVDCAYACLTHLGVQAQRAQGHTKKNRVLRLEPISKLKASLRQMVWQDTIKDVVKYSHEKPVIRRLEKLLAA
ncbi:MAG TPA: transposase [Bacteroidales bacterium]|nr:transposase [Bacteroidales bacterium]